MRDSLHACPLRQVLRLAVIGVALATATPAMAAGKILRPEAADRMEERTTATAPVPVAPVQAMPAGQETAAVVAPQKPAGGKAAVDPNAPEPLSERAQAALDRAKRALADEEMGDGDPEPQAAPGQPVDPRGKSAAAGSKSAVKCVAGC